MTSMRLPGEPDPLSHHTRVLTLKQLEELGISRGQRRAHVAAERWADLPGHGVVTDLGPVEGRSAWWRALCLLGPRARLGGITALEAVGLTGYDEHRTHVWVPKSTYKGHVAHVGRVVLHESRRWDEADASEVGIPRARPAVAAVQAALWSASARQALLCLVMPIQQRLTRPDDVAEVLTRIRRHRFRRVLQESIHDIASGSQSLGELDFTRMCVDHRLPVPSRQVVRHTSQGRICLDVHWEAYRVAVEVNGAGHGRLDRAMSDEIRTIDLQLSGDAAVQVSVLTLRCAPDPFFARLADLLRANGWTGMP